MNVKLFVQMETIAFCCYLCRQWHKFKAAGKHALSFKRRKYIPKYIVEQLSEHFESAVIFMKVILVGKLTEILKNVSVIHSGMHGDGGYVSVCVKVAFLWCGV